MRSHFRFAEAPPQFVTLPVLPWLGEIGMAGEFEGIIRVRKWGNSYVLVLPPEIKEFFAVVPRDMIAYRKVGRVVVLRRICHGDLLPMTPGEKRYRVLSAEAERE